MKKWGFLFIFSILIGILGVSLFNHKKGVYGQAFAKIPVRFIPFINAPTIILKINGSSHSLNIDLGCSHDFVLDREVLDKIELKEPLETILWHDLNGNNYSSLRFRIPKIDIGEGIQILGAIASEESVDFITHGSQVLPDVFFIHKAISTLYSSFVDGRIGWNIFKQCVCFFDFQNSELCVAKDLQSLVMDAGCSVEGFIHAPLEIKDCGVLLSVETDIGEKKFLLDTGSTWSLIRRESLGPEGIYFRTNKFFVGGVDLGKQKFRAGNFSDRFSCDGILGVDFFKGHAVCLDFQNKMAYIKRVETPSEKFMTWMKE